MRGVTEFQPPINSTLPSSRTTGYIEISPKAIVPVCENVPL
jgi:hypothetical protein